MGRVTVVALFVGLVSMLVGCGDDSATDGWGGFGGEGGEDGAGGAPEIPVEEAVVAVTDPGEPLGPVIEVTVPVTGGTVESADGRFAIEVPPGALEEETTLTIQPITSSCPGALGLGYRLGPEGQTFAAPVKLHYHYAPEDLDGSEALALRMAYHLDDGRWSSIHDQIVDEEARTLSIETTHFSDWEPYAAWQLTPPTAMTAPSEYVGLQVRVCNWEEDAIDPGNWIVKTCAPDEGFFTTDEWAVNGKPGGSASTGTVSGGIVDGTANFLAPSAAPPSNPVAVSAAVTEKSGRKTLLVSSIWIDDHPPLTGTIVSRQANTLMPDNVYSTSANVTFVWNYSMNQYNVASGTFSAFHDEVAPGGADCEIHTSLEGTLGPRDGTIIFQGELYFGYGSAFGVFSGTTTCTATGDAEPLSRNDFAVWWPSLVSGMSPKEGGILRETLIGVSAAGAKVNMTWSLAPTTH